jgi:hypothetical protein
MVLVLAIPSVGMGMDMAKRWGFGYYTGSAAPLGVRVWLGPKTGLDLGVGFSSTDLGAESAMRLAAEIGVPIILMPTERANFFVRPGLLFESVDDRLVTGTTDEKWTVIEPSVSLGAEVFFGNNFSLEAASGVAFSIQSPPDSVGTDSFTDFGSFADGIAELGFHFYFK